MIRLTGRISSSTTSSLPSRESACLPVSSKESTISEVDCTVQPWSEEHLLICLMLALYSTLYATSCFVRRLDMCNSAESLQRKLRGTKDVALERLVAALRDPLTLDNARAEWVAQQLLESGEKGILLPVNVVLDAYIRGKSR